MDNDEFKGGICEQGLVNFSKETEVDDFTDDGTSIYKILPLEYFIALVENKELTLRRIDTWTDLIECIVDSIIVNYKGNLCEGSSSKNKIFSSSWTKSDENDKMWEIYSPDKTSVRIKSTCHKLCDLIINFAMKYRFSPIHPLDDKDYTLSKDEVINLHKNMILLPVDVCYKNGLGDIINVVQEHLDKVMEGKHQTPFKCGCNVYNQMIRCMKYKQDSFSFEQETRVAIYTDNIDGLKDEGESLPIPIIPDDFITGITFDPRLSGDDVVDLTKKFRELGLGCEIKQSEMDMTIIKDAN